MLEWVLVIAIWTGGHSLELTPLHGYPTLTACLAAKTTVSIEMAKEYPEDHLLQYFCLPREMNGKPT